MVNFIPLYHKLKSFIGYSIATIVIIVAIGVSAFRLILTSANLYQNEVEQLASKLLKHPVKIGSMDAKLSHFVPTLILKDVQLISKGTKKNLFSLNRVDIGLSFNDLLFSQTITAEEIIIRGLDLQVKRTDKGGIKIKGFDFNDLTAINENEFGSFFDAWLLQQGQVSLEDSTITWVDEQHKDVRWVFEEIDLLLTKKHERYQFFLSSKLPSILGGEITMSLDLVGDISKSETWNVKTFVESKGVNLEPLKKYIENKEVDLIKGNADIKLWLNWEDKEIKHLSGDVMLHNISYSLGERKKVNLKLVSGIFDARKNEKNTWHVSLDKFNYISNSTQLNGASFSLAFNYNNKSFETFYVKADAFKLDSISKLISDNYLGGVSFEKNIKQLALKGDVHDLSIAWNNHKLHSLYADFTGFSSNAWGNSPNVKSLSGNLMYEKNEGIISLFSNKSIIGFPLLFRKNFIFDDLSADISFSNTKNGIYFDIKHLNTKNEHLRAISKAALWVPKNGSSPYLDFQTYVSAGDASNVSKYLPVGIMDDALIKWLDQGIVSGKVNNGNIIFSGRLEDFPFNDNNGVFYADIDASNVVVDYWKGWPEISNAKIKGSITGQGLSVHLIEGNVEGASLFNSDVTIDSFSESELKININTSGSTHNLMQYLVNSPILPKAKKLINNSRLLGDVAGYIKIRIPLDEKTRKRGSLSYSGKASLNKASLFMLDDKVDFKNASGDILFNEKKIYSENLIADVFDEKIKLSISSSSKNIKISGSGKIRPGMVMKRFKIPGEKNISGSTSFYGNMFFPLSSRKNAYPRLSISSNLKGVKSKFPDMLYKRRNEKQAVKLKTTFLDEKFQIGIYFNKKGSSVLEMVTKKKNTYFNKGAISFSKRKAVLPKQSILYIDGSIETLTPAKWTAALSDKKKGNGKDFLVKPIVLNLEKLNIFSSNNKSIKKYSNVISPINIPVFNGVIKKLRFNNMFLGRLDLKMSKSKKGLRFDEILLSTKNMNLFSHGGWSYSRGKHKTNMNITLKSENVGNMLVDLGLPSFIEKGNANTISKLYWRGAPTDFSLAKLFGDVKLNIENGNIKNIDAGAGRLLGLVSLSALPRKLFGDFKDTFKSGFSFDSAKGDIKIREGDAFTRYFTVKSSVSKIKITGRTGLAKRDYNNIITVIPDVGGGLAGIAALVVSLPAGIGLWLFDKMTGEQFNEASTRVYDVKGSWDNPKIVLINNK